MFFVHNFSLPLLALTFTYILFGIIVQIFTQIGYRNNFVIYLCTHCILGHTVAQLVEALRYKLEGRGFDYR
jgi:hypothetical protein